MNLEFKKFDADQNTDTEPAPVGTIDDAQITTDAIDKTFGETADTPAIPDLAPSSPGNRLYVRRWLLLIIASVLFAHYFLANLSVEASLISFAILATIALVMPPIGHSLGLSLPQQYREDPKRRDKIIRQSFQTIVDSLPDPAILLTKEGTLVYFNAEASELLGDLRQGLHISSVIRNPEFLDAVSRAPSSERPLTVYYSGRVPVGRRLSSIIANITPQTNNNDAPRLLATFKDLTQLERINQMRADFIANASHELRTPLASLMGFIETLQGPAKEDPEARDRFLDIMSKQAERMTRLINDLLSLSRVEMNAHLRPADRVEINEAVTYVVDTMEPIARDAEISLTISPLPEPVYVRGEREELVQVFQNLVQNAIRYGIDNGHVDVFIERRAAQHGKDTAIAITVEDDGPGISPEHLPRLTERFYRVDVNSSRDKGGTGLGLAIVKHIVTRHRGELEIHSTLGKGSRFTIILEEWPSAIR